MRDMQQYHFNISAPNLVNICIDENQYGEISGRMYHCYSEEPLKFSNIIELLRDMEQLFDVLGFPQASTKTRSFLEREQKRERALQKPEQVVSQRDIIENSGKKGTFVTSVRFRQNSTWQGEFFWMEKGVLRKFSNTLEFLWQIDAALTEL